MKLSIYQIEQDHLQLIEQLMENGGELTPEIESSLKINQENLTTKGTNYGYIIKQLEGECAIIKSEKDRLDALQKTRERSIERLKSALSTAMQIFQVEEIKSPVMKISFRRSESVEIDNLDLVPFDYKILKESVTADKKAIKAAIESGVDVQGARIQINQNIQIK